MDKVVKTNWSERLKYGVKKFGWDSDFIKSFLSMTAQLRHHELDKFFDDYLIPNPIEKDTDFKSGSLYPTDDEILKMVEDFTKDLNVSNATKRATEFGYQEGIYKMIDIWKRSNNELDCPYDFTSRCTIDRCDCKPKTNWTQELQDELKKDIEELRNEFNSEKLEQIIKTEVDSETGVIKLPKHKMKTPKDYYL